MQFQKKSKAISLFLSGTLLFSITACGKKDEASTTNKEGGSSNQQASFSYTMPGKYMNWLKDLKWFPQLEKETNTDVKLVDGGSAGDQYYKNIDLKLSSGEFSDAGIVRMPQVQLYGPQGAFADLKPLIDQYGPNIKKYIDSNPEYKALITSADGKIYGLPTEYTKISPVTYYREDMFKKAEITNLPKNIEEFTSDLKKLKETYKDVKDFYPLTGRDLLNTGNFLDFQYAFGAGDTIDSSGKVHGNYFYGQGNDIHSPGFKKLIEWYRGLYSDGLIDPEFVAGTLTEEAWQTKMLNGKGAVNDDFFTRPSWFMNNGGPKNDPNFSLKVMPAFQDINGVQTPRATNPRFDIERVFVINAKSKHAADAIKFLDYLYTDKGQTTMHYGVEGQSYKVDNGQKAYTVKFEEEGNKPLGTAVWNFLQDRLTFPAPVDNDTYYKWMDPLTKSFATEYFNKYTKSYPILKYSNDQVKQRTELNAKVQPYVNSELVNFVTGKKSMSEWDAFLSQADNLGYNKIEAIDQAAYDALKK